MLDLEKIKERAKEGAHYAHWLYVYPLIAEVETLREQLIKLTADADPSNLLDEEDV